jgi:hypothetical protein
VQVTYADDWERLADTLSAERAVLARIRRGLRGAGRPAAHAVLLAPLIAALVVGAHTRLSVEVPAAAVLPAPRQPIAPALVAALHYSAPPPAPAVQSAVPAASQSTAPPEQTPTTADPTQPSGEREDTNSPDTTADTSTPSSPARHHRPQPRPSQPERPVPEPAEPTRESVQQHSTPPAAVPTSPQQLCSAGAQHGLPEGLLPMCHQVLG